MFFVAWRSSLGQDPSPGPGAACRGGLRWVVGVCARVEGMAFDVSDLDVWEQAIQAPVLLQTGVGFGVQILGLKDETLRFLGLRLWGSGVGIMVLG